MNDREQEAEMERRTEGDATAGPLEANLMALAERYEATSKTCHIQEMFKYRVRSEVSMEDARYARGYEQRWMQEKREYERKIAELEEEVAPVRITQQAWLAQAKKSAEANRIKREEAEAGKEEPVNGYGPGNPLYMVGADMASEEEEPQFVYSVVSMQTNGTPFFHAACADADDAMAICRVMNLLNPGYPSEVYEEALYDPKIRRTDGGTYIVVSCEDRGLQRVEGVYITEVEASVAAQQEARDSRDDPFKAREVWTVIGYKLVEGCVSLTECHSIDTLKMGVEDNGLN